MTTLRRIAAGFVLAFVSLSLVAPAFALPVAGVNGGSTTPTTNFVPMGRIYDYDGVPNGTAKVVGGRAYQAVSSTDTLLASAGASAHVAFAQSYTMPANTCKAGTRIRIAGRVTVADASGADTLEVKVYLGTAAASGTTLITTTAVNPGATTDFHMFNFQLVCRAAPGATSAIIGQGNWLTDTGGTEVSDTVILATTNFATNGALVISASGKWSSTTASTSARLDDLSVEIL